MGNCKLTCFFTTFSHELIQGYDGRASSELLNKPFDSMFGWCVCVCVYMCLFLGLGPACEGKTTSAEPNVVHK